MFTPRVPLEAGVQIERLFDVKEITNGDSEKSFFTPSPSGVVTDNNYRQNPLPGINYRVLLGISINLTVAAIEEDANIDPVKVINGIKDAVLTLSTNEGRNQDFIHPIKDYLNLSGLEAALTSAASDDAVTSMIALQSTGIRQTDNLFYLKPNESFTLKVNFNNSVWPTTANWTTAGHRFGLQTEIWVAEMNEAQFSRYKTQLGA